MTDLQIQLLLAYLGYDPGTLDGIMGKNTRAAVVAFQAAEGLDADGIPGTQTQARLREAVFQGRQRKEDIPAAVETKSGDWWDEIQYFSRNDPYIACSCGKCGGFPVSALSNTGLAPVSECYDGGVYIYSDGIPSAAITIPTIICWRGGNAE